MHTYSLNLSLLAFFLALTGQSAWCEPPVATPHLRPVRVDRYGDPLPNGAIRRIGTTRLRHNSHIAKVLFTPDGKFVISAGDETGDSRQAVYLWEIATGRLVRRFPGWFDTAGIALSANGAVLAVDTDNQIHLHDTATGKRFRTIRTMLLANIHQPTFSPDGKSLIALLSSVDQKHPMNGILRWETATGKTLDHWRMSANQPVALSADGRFVASIERKKDPPTGDTIRLWELATHKKLREWKAARKIVIRDRFLIFSPDGRSLVAVDGESTIRVYETATGKEVRNWKVCDRKLRIEDSGSGGRFVIPPLGCLVFSPNGSILTSVDDTELLQLWDWKTGRELRHFEHIDSAAAFSPDSKILAAGGEDARIHLWDTATGRRLRPFADPGNVESIAFPPDGRTLAAISDASVLRLLDVTAGREWKMPGYHFRAFAPDGGSVLALHHKGNQWGPLCLLDAAAGKEQVRFRDTDDEDDLIGWNPDRKRLMTIIRHGKFSTKTVRAWDTATGKQLWELKQGGDKRISACVCPDGRLVALAVEKETAIRLLAGDTGKELARLAGYGYVVEYHAEREKASIGTHGTLGPDFAPDGKVVLAGIDRNSFGLWDVATGKRFLRLSCDQLAPSNPIFSPDGELLALLDTHGDPCLVETATGRVRHQLTLPSADLSWIWDSPRAFTADGRLFATGYNDHTLIVWETATGRPIRIWPGHGKGTLKQMLFSPDGRRLATVDSYGTALLWDVIGLSADGRLPPRKLTPAEAEKAWSELAEADAAKAHRAIWMLVADPPRALPLLRQRLRPMPHLKPQRLAQLIADLDSDEFTVREKATRELRKLAEMVAPVLRQALKNRPTLELRRRAQGLLAELDAAVPSSDRLRLLRALAVLEYMASTESRQLLRVLADGAPEARLTREANASLQRLAKRGQSIRDR